MAVAINIGEPQLWILRMQRADLHGSPPEKFSRWRSTDRGAKRLPGTAERQLGILNLSDFPDAELALGDPRAPAKPIAFGNFRSRKSETIDNSDLGTYHRTWAETNLDQYYAVRECIFSMPLRGGLMSAVVYHPPDNRQTGRAQAPCAENATETLSAPEASAQTRSRFPVNLNTHICGVLRAEEPRLSSHIVIRRRVDPDLWPIRGDEELIQELVLALALNAVDAIEDEGRVIFETRNLRLEEGCLTRATGLKPGPYVLLLVEDTGRGLTADALALVFTPIEPTERSSNRPVLAGVKKITELHEGHVCVFSTPGEGTVVRVYLPAEPPQEV